MSRSGRATPKAHSQTQRNPGLENGPGRDGDPTRRGAAGETQRWFSSAGRITTCSIAHGSRRPKGRRLKPGAGHNLHVGKQRQRQTGVPSLLSPDLAHHPSGFSSLAAPSPGTLYTQSGTLTQPTCWRVTSLLANRTARPRSLEHRNRRRSGLKTAKKLDKQDSRGLVAPLGHAQMKVVPVLTPSTRAPRGHHQHPLQGAGSSHRCGTDASRQVPPTTQQKGDRCRHPKGPSLPKQKGRSSGRAPRGPYLYDCVETLVSHHPDVRLSIVTAQQEKFHSDAQKFLEFWRISKWKKEETGTAKKTPEGLTMNVARCAASMWDPGAEGGRHTG